MPKTQVNARLSDYTRERLDVLTAKHGTQTEVLAIAIERLYGAEYPDSSALYDAAASRVRDSEALAPHADFILTDWPREGDDHWRWVITAPEAEIVSWALAGQD